MSDSTLVSVRLSEELWERFKIACVVQNKNASAQVAVLIDAWVEGVTPRAPKEKQS